uniref:Serpin family A member 6 n=1 Tax=Bos indicus x Bos taurus TaxID=30522 RepID=A0A4W2C779_BOBOX
MLPTLYTCLLWLSTSGLWTVQAKGSDTDMSTRNPHRDLAPNNVDFAFTLYKHLVASAPGKNVFISPVSISTALAMLSLGARGYTREQLLQGLGFNLTEMSEGEIHRAFRHLHHLLRESNTTLDMTMGNALFLDHSLELLESFSADTKHYYELEALTTDFQDWAGASRQINEYIKNKTQGNIVDLFSESDSSATLILVNYIFFKGMWAHSFDLESTREENFHVNEATTVQVPMMFQSNTIKYLNDSVLPCQLVQLDYTGNETVFFVLPVKGKMDSVITALSRDTIQRWSKSLTMRVCACEPVFGPSVHPSIMCSVVSDSLQPRECQVPLFMGFSSQEYWSGLPFPPPGDRPNTRIKPMSSALQVDSLRLEPLGKPHVWSIVGTHLPVFLVNRPIPTSPSPLEGTL